MLDKEKVHCRSLLRDLPDDVIFNLAETVTKKQISPTSVKDAIDAIVAYSATASELLSRKKLQRNLLFKYLHRESIYMPLNSTKDEIIERILKHWGNDKPKTHTVAHQDEDRISSSQASVSNPAPFVTYNITHVQHHNVFYEQSVQTSTNISNYNASQTPGHATDSFGAHPFQNNQVIASDHIASISDEWQSLGEKFSTWFYDNLNSHNPSFGKVPQDFGPHHFLDDVVMHLLCKTSDTDVRKESFSGSQSVSDRLLAFVRDEQILFNPNISREGIITKSSPHGLILVVICGTVHRVNQCLGLFDQMFGLIKDPFVENNFKIKLTKLKLQTSQITSMPKQNDKSEAEIQDLLAV